MKTINKLLSISILLTAVSGTAWAASDVDETRPLSRTGTLSVNNLAGELELVGWDRDEVSIKGQLGDSVEELEIIESPNGLKINVKNESKQSSWFGSDDLEETYLTIRMPNTASVEVETVSADVSVDGSAGENLSVTTVSGDISVTAEPDHLEINSVSGDIEFNGAANRSTIESVSGDVDASGVDGEVAITSVSGDVDLSAGVLQRGRFETVSGELTLDVSVADNGRITVESMSGDVNLSLPGADRANIDAQTFSGEITSDMGRVTSPRRGPGSSLEYEPEGADASIRLESFSGDIDIDDR